MLILGTYRPIDAIVRAHPLPTVITELLQHDRCAEIVLDYLSEAAVADYLTRRLGAKPFPDHLSHMLHQRTNGNPLFLITVVNALVSQGILEETARAWRLRGGYETIVGIVPDSLRLLIERYVEQLPPEDQTILEAASVMGQTFGQWQQAHAALSAAMAMYCAMDITFWVPQVEAALAQVERQ